MSAERPDADEREWNIDHHLVFRIIATDPSPAEALRSFVRQEVEAATSRTPDAHLAAAKAEGWDECAREAHALGWLHDWALSDAVERNPYRARAARLREQGDR